MAHETWQVQEAKADLSALIRAVEEEGPQTITRHGRTVAVVLSVSEYQRLLRRSQARRGSLLEFFAAWPSLEIPERDHTDVGREVSI
jgi:prevent-host-death family protein